MTLYNMENYKLPTARKILLNSINLMLSIHLSIEELEGYLRGQWPSLYIITQKIRTTLFSHYKIANYLLIATPIPKQAIHQWQMDLLSDIDNLYIEVMPTLEWWLSRTDDNHIITLLLEIQTFMELLIKYIVKTETYFTLPSLFVGADVS